MGSPTPPAAARGNGRAQGRTAVAEPAADLNRLPAEAAGFVGRRGELGEIGRLLSASRLVTLVGPGGVGKTRLALRAAATAGPSFRDGARLVELARLRDPLLLAQSVVDVLDIQDRSDRTAVEVLSAYLADRELLLVFDNCEHLAGPCALLVEALLRAAPGLKVLATSRQPLGVVGEQLFAVPPMRVPAGDRMPGARALGRYEAVSLFQQRAAAVLPGFAVSDANAEPVARLVSALDGLPLAIELAASWLRVLPVEEVLHRLTDRFALLDAGTAVGPQPARRTLRELMDWSFGLCSPQEQLLWARVSVFSGGFDLAAAEAVCSGDGIPRAAVLGLVAGLVDKSVLIRQETPAGVRFQLLETVREYGYDRLEGVGESTRTRRRHRDHFRQLREEADAHWFGPEQVLWFDRLRADHPNLRAALEFCVSEPGEADTGMEMAGRPRNYWVAIGSISEGRQWLMRLLAAADPDDSSAVRTRAMGLNAWFAVLTGRLAEAEPLLTEYNRRAERLGDVSELAWGFEYRGAAMGFADPTDTATIAVFEAAVSGHRSLGELEGLTSDLFMQAIGEALIGDVEQALALSRESVAVSDGAGESFVRSYSIFSMALATWMTGDRAAADGLLREAVRLKRNFRDRWGLALCVELTFWSAAEDGAYDRAAHLLGILHALWDGLGASMEESVPFMIEAHEVYVARVRENLGPRALRTAVERGARLTPEQIVEDILKDGAAPADAGPGVRLTRRERQVAELVAQGMSNKEISASLVISLRTAENHVEHILTKLGFSSRTQIAVWAAQHTESE